MMTRISSVLFPFVLVWSGLAIGGCSPTLRDGWYACASPLECPSGFTCQSGRCGRGVGTECRVDLHCDDGDLCTLDICESGLCSHDPETGQCDDGDFCNGPEECRSGVCTNIGPPPCPGACDLLGCSDCGRIGVPCCDGFCAEGACDGLTCQACGATGEACCFGELACNDFDATCDGFTCVTCGGDGAPCCSGGFCDGALLCDGVRCSADPECSGVACPGTEVCVGGDCFACGNPGEFCCGGACVTGTCDPGSGLCETRTCGGPGEPCCGTLPDCGMGLACTSDPSGGVEQPICRSCGMVEGDPCCPPGAGSLPCPGVGLACEPSSGSCVPCGASEGRCCDMPGSECTDASDACVAGFCRSSCGEDGEACCPLRRCAAFLTCGVGDVCR